MKQLLEIVQMTANQLEQNDEMIIQDCHPTSLMINEVRRLKDITNKILEKSYQANEAEYVKQIMESIK